jgi:hypothetical protein
VQHDSGPTCNMQHAIWVSCILRVVRGMLAVALHHSSYGVCTLHVASSFYLVVRVAINRRAFESALNTFCCHRCIQIF